MRIRFLGTGTSQGVPLIACTCNVCTSSDSRDQRLRSSILIESDTTTVVVDSGPDFRQQMLREKVSKLDAIVFTHEHKDHIAGLDDVRAYNYILQQSMHVYCTNQVREALYREFHYAFSDKKYPGVPEIELHEIHASQGFAIGDIQLQPIEVIHYKLPVLGFRVKNFAYITDANYISEEEQEKLKNLDILVLNALRHEAHPSHFTLNEALQLIEKLQPKQAYLTHISHQLGTYESLSPQLPSHVQLAYDGLSFSI